MKYYGYHRTSTIDQHLGRGLDEINEYCKAHNFPLERIFTDQQTGKNFDRPRYKVMKEDVLREGDTLIITEVDRLGRNKADTLKELQYYREHKVRVMILEIPTSLVEIKDDGNSLMLEMITNILIEVYTCMAQAEMIKKEKRQREGIEQKKARGETFGRPFTAGRDEFFSTGYQRVLSGELKAVELMRKLNISKPTYYRYKDEYEQRNG